jgi:murein DD-endopeptidase MepM/ murein hydrolase activator NlpD
MRTLLSPPKLGIIFRASTFTTAPNIRSNKRREVLAAQELPFAERGVPGFGHCLSANDFRYGGILSVVAIWILAALAVQQATAEIPTPTLPSPFVALDLNVGDSQDVKVPGGGKVTVKLLDVQDHRDSLRGAVRRSEVKVQVSGEAVTLGSGTYHLPVKVANVRIDCPITKGYIARANKMSSSMDAWGLEKDARLRVWPADGPLIDTKTFMYPARQAWFATCTQMSNEPSYVDGGEKPGMTGNIYYHYGLDIGGAEGLVDVVAATDGLVVSRGTERLSGYEGTPVAPRYDVVYLLDDRGWFYRYSHLHTIAASVKLGDHVKMGDAIGLLGKEGGSGGWSHLHFDISGKQPSGKYGIVDGYAFLWEANLQERKPKLIAVARPHHFVSVGEKVMLDGSKSWSAAGKIAKYEWTCTDGQTATGDKLERTYSKPGVYSEVLKITDSAGLVDYDFAFVDVVDREHLEQLPPSIHPAFAPTQGIKPGDTIKFLVRTFGTTDGEETWDFGDDSPKVTVHSDGNVNIHAKDGYAITTHKYNRPGVYLASVQRTDRRGFTAVGRLKVVVGDR